MAHKFTGLEVQEDIATLADRRRPGRMDFHNQHLIELLRDRGEGRLPGEAAEEPAVAAGDAGMVEADVDALAPARGVVLGVMIGAGLWLAGGLTVWMLL